MVENSTIAIIVFIISLAAYVAFIIKKKSYEDSENFKINQLEKLAEYISSTGSLEKGIRQLISQDPASTANYNSIIKKADTGTEFEKAIYETSKESTDRFFSQICIMLIAVNRKNDGNMLYNSVQKIKKASQTQRSIEKGSNRNSWILQLVFCMIIPLIFYFMIGVLGFQSDIYLDFFLTTIVGLSILYQGIAFKQWNYMAIKAPIWFSLFYILYFVIAPKFLGGMFSGII